MKKLLFIFPLFLGSTFVLSAQENTIARFDSLLDIYEANDRLMASVAISKEGEIIYKRSIGYASVEENIPHNADTKFRIGSISKTFTSVLIFQLIEEGKLSLDTRLSEYFPEVPNAKDISIKNLLNHSSGIFNMTALPDYQEWDSDPQTREDLLARMQELEPVFEPGARNEYSNSNFLYLTFILEDITGKSYQELVENRIVEKLNLKNTYYGKPADPGSNESYSYQYVGGEWVKEAETDLTIPLGAGGIVSTPTDLIIFMEALFDLKLISEESLEKMTEDINGFGQGIFKIPFGSKYGYGHSGGIDGFRSNVGYLPEDDITVAFTSNGIRDNMNDVMIGLLYIAHGLPFEMPSYSTYEVNPDKLVAYEGDFVSAQMPLQLNFKVENGVLTVQGTNQPRFPLEPVEDDKFELKMVKAILHFEKNEDGQYNSLKLEQNGMKFDFKRKE